MSHGCPFCVPPTSQKPLDGDPQKQVASPWMDLEDNLRLDGRVDMLLRHVFDPNCPSEGG
eukprot:89025-Amorphochlora_amoeboformis.AAC.1